MRTANPNRVRLGHRPGLDAVRGVAVVSIVLYHADPGWFPLAPMSLDVFFVLSTFLVTTTLLDALAGRGGPDGRRFFTRRARRLAAGLALMLAVVLTLGALGVYSSPELADTALGAALLHANVAQFGGDYFSAFAERNPLEHTWSLSVEEHFYLFTFAAVAVAWLLTRRHLGRTRAVLAGLALLVAAASVLTSRSLLEQGATANRIYMGTDTRAVAAAAGVALAALSWGRWDVHGRARQVLRAAAALLVALALGATATGWRPDLGWYAGGGWALTAAGSAVIVAALASSDRAGRLTGSPPLQWAGRRSYGIYLWHLPLLVLALELGTPGLLAALAATAVAAEVSHRLVERPFRLGWPTDRAFVPATAAAFAVVAVLATALPAPQVPEWASRPVADRATPPAVQSEVPPEGPRSGGTDAADASGAAAQQRPQQLTVWGDAAASLVGEQLAADGRFEVDVQANPECAAPATCTDRVPVPDPATRGPVVVALADPAPFHPLPGSEWDLDAPERSAADLWLRISGAAGGRPLVVAMAPEARRDLGVGLHLRRMAADDPSNLVLDAEPAQWPDAIADRFATGAVQPPTKVLLVGDSVAYSLGTAFRPDGTVVWDQSRHGCDPSPGDRVTQREGRDRTPPACDWRSDWRRAVDSWGPDVVVWHTGTWSTYDRFVGGRMLEAGSAEWHDAVADAHAEALGILGSGGARVLVAVTAPAWETSRGKPAETTPAEAARRTPLLAEAIHSAASGRREVEVVETAEVLCVPDCDRPELRDDGVHYTPEGARVVADWIAAKVQRS